MGKFSEVIKVNVDLLVPHELNEELFGKMSEADLEMLARSIKEHGMIDIIVIMKSEKYPGKFEILAGHERVKAAKKNGQKEVEARIFTPDYPGEEIEIMLDSNLLRKFTTYSSLEKIAKIRAANKSLKDVERDLIQGLRELLKQNKVSFNVLSLISNCNEAEQKEFLSLLQLHREVKGDRMEIEDYQDILKAKKMVEKENPELAEKLKKLSYQLTIKEQLLEKYKKELMGKENLYKRAFEDKLKAEEEVKNLRKKIEQAKEEGRKEAQKELEKELERKLKELEQKVKEAEQARTQSDAEAAVLRRKIERVEGELRAEQIITKKYKEKLQAAMEEIQKVRIEERKKAKQKEKELEMEKQKVMSGEFQKKVGGFYDDPQMRDELREKLLFLQDCCLQMKVAIGSITQLRTMGLADLIDKRNYPDGVFPWPVETLKKRFITIGRELRDLLMLFLGELAEVEREDKKERIVRDIKDVMDKKTIDTVNEHAGRRRNRR